MSAGIARLRVRSWRRVGMARSGDAREVGC